MQVLTVSEIEQVSGGFEYVTAFEAVMGEVFEVCQTAGDIGVAIGLSAAAGVATGSAFNYIWESTTGSTFGGSLYDAGQDFSDWLWTTY